MTQSPANSAPKKATEQASRDASSHALQASPEHALASAARLTAQQSDAGPGQGQLIDLDVQGMTCASCAARIEKKLNKVDGVQASVNYATERAHVLAPPNVTAEQLIQVVRDTGYDAQLPTPEQTPPDRAAEIKRRLIVAACLAIPVIVMAMVPALQFPGWQWLSLVLATPVVWWCGWPFHRSAWTNLKHRATTMDTLISMGTSTAYLWSLIALIFGDAGHIGMRHEWAWQLERDAGLSSVYFEAACGIIVFLLLGRYIEARSRQDASAALRELAKAGAKTAILLRDGHEVEVPIEKVQVGDRFIVLPATKVPTDGRIIEGRSAMDNSVITGESMPVEVGPGDAVVGAAVNTTGRLVVEATAVGEDTQLSQIAKLVEQAQTGKSASQDLANRISSVFVPVVIGISLVTLVAWLIASRDVSFAITAAVSVLIISCPCALGLATPTALLAGSLRGSQLGVLIRGPHALEQAHKVQTITMDKTGTITAGRMTLTDQLAVAGVSEDELLCVAASLEQSSSHPIAKAILAATGKVADAVDVETIPGRGLQGLVDDQLAFAGNRALLADQGITVPAELDRFAAQAGEAGASLVYVARAGQALGALAVSDQIADGSPAAIKELHELGLHTVMLTGDNQTAAERVAAQVGIDEVRAEVLPGDKFDVVKELQDAGQIVAMVGDGVNDAAALSQADLGISLADGTDAAQSASDLTLMRHDLGLVVDAIRLSRRTYQTIRSNLFWAFFYNVLAIPVAALGFLNPMIAGAAMAFSSVFVVTNSFRLRFFQPNRRTS